MKKLTFLQQQALIQKNPIWINNQSITNCMPAIDLLAAHALWQRFAPFFSEVFHDVGDDGLIESPLLVIKNFQTSLEKQLNISQSKNLLLKSDDCLPVVGSIKARGGIFEVCQLAEKIAIDAGLLSLTDDYRKLTHYKFRELFSKYQIIVGSTGNLGLSVGTIASVFGFRVSVHMSSDAKDWKKSALRSRSVNVIEHFAAYHIAVDAARKEALKDNFSYFVDDENSLALLTGYACSAQRLFKQLQDQQVNISDKSPLYVYLPCGVGGAPAGICYGLKQYFGDNLRCVVVEPVAAPALMVSTLSDQKFVDFQLDGKTIADGLAVTQASKLATKILQTHAYAFCTVTDDDLLKIQSQLFLLENHYVEPSAAAGLIAWIANCQQNDQADAHHIIWSTGGSMVPMNVRLDELKKGKSLLQQPYRLPERIES